MFGVSEEQLLALAEVRVNFLVALLVFWAQETDAWIAINYLVLHITIRLRMHPIMGDGVRRRRLLVPASLLVLKSQSIQCGLNRVK